MFNYRNIVTGLIFITLWIVLITINCNNNRYVQTDRYQLFKDSDNTILLDKQTGMTWRNVWNNSKDKIPSDWEYMEHLDKVNLPIGPKKAHYQSEISKANWDKFMDEAKYEALTKQDQYYIKKLSKYKSSMEYNKIEKEMLQKGYSKEKIKEYNKLATVIFFDTEKLFNKQLKPYKHIYQ